MNAHLKALRAKYRKKAIPSYEQWAAQMEQEGGHPDSYWDRRVRLNRTLMGKYAPIPAGSLGTIIPIGSINREMRYANPEPKTGTVVYVSFYHYGVVPVNLEDLNWVDLD